MMFQQPQRNCNLNLLKHRDSSSGILLLIDILGISDFGFRYIFGKGLALKGGALDIEGGGEA